MPSILLTGPAAEPITLARRKQFLRVEHDDDDDVIAALIAGSRIHVEAQTRRALITQSWRLTRDAWPGCGRLAVLPVPLRTLDAARVYRLRRQHAGARCRGVRRSTRRRRPRVLAFTRGALPAPGRPVAGIEIDVTCGYGDGGAMCPSRCARRSGCWSRTGTRTAGSLRSANRSPCCRNGVAALIAPYRVLAL